MSNNVFRQQDQETEFKEGGINEGEIVESCFRTIEGNRSGKKSFSQPEFTKYEAKKSDQIGRHETVLHVFRKHCRRGACRRNRFLPNFEKRDHFESRQRHASNDRAGHGQNRFFA